MFTPLDAQLCVAELSTVRVFEHQDHGQQ